MPPSSRVELPPRSSDTWSRSRTSPDEISSIADALLRGSLNSASAPIVAELGATSSATRPAPVPGTVRTRNDPPTGRVELPSSASLLRSPTTRHGVRISADEMLRRSLIRTIDAPGPLPIVAPPPYSGTRTAIGNELMGSPSTEPLHHELAVPGSSPGSFEERSLNPSRPTSTSEAKRRVRELEREVNLAKAGAGPRSTKGIFKAACSTDLLFLIDTTSSMRRYIDSAKEQVKSIVADVQKYFFNEAQMRVAVVSYRDHTSKVNVQFKDFTTSTAEIYAFLDGLKVMSGVDIPEDVLGGIQQALHASWNQQTRCMIHIADAPPHGEGMHDLGARIDNYFEPGSEPHRLSYAPLIQSMVKLQVNYGLLRINPSTDRMAFVFSQIYAAAGAAVRLLEENKYHAQNLSGSLASARLQFEEMNLGASLSDVRRLVVRMVTKSVSSSATRIADAISHCSPGRSFPTRSPRPGTLSMIHEGHQGHAAAAEILLDKSDPQWTMGDWFDKTWHVEGYCPDVVHNARTLTSMITSDDSIKLSYAELTIHARSVPFGKGGVRTACYARTAASKSPYVLKSFIKTGQSKAALIEEMRMQALCKSFALEFNSMLKLEKPIDFVVTTCVQPKSRATSECEHMSLEPYIPGKYIKYNGNNGYVHGDEDHPFFDVAQAFSHYTFERSWGHMLVNDLQGVDNILTDPAVQTKDPKRFHLSPTNFNTDGFKLWFSSHQTCNDICRKLDLKSTGAMLLTGKFHFRGTWPLMEPTTCCSSKLCRKIITLADAETSGDLPDFQWCDECWVQLTTEQRACSVSGPHHTFEVSDFFHESQGQLSPTQCLRHRVKDTSHASTAAIGGRLFSSIRAQSSTNSFIDGRTW